MARLTAEDKTELQSALLRRLQKWPNDYQTPAEWNFCTSGYSTAQIKAALDALTTEGKIKRNQVGRRTYYGVN